MKKSIFLVAFLFFCVVSCTKIAGVLFGAKDPNKNLQTDTMVTDYVNKIGLNKDFNFRPKKLENYKTVLGYFQNGAPEALIFDKNGNELLYKADTVECNAGLFATIPTLKKETQLKNGKLTLDDILNKLDRIDNSSESLEKESYDYLLVIDWAIFMGEKLSKDHVLVWEKLARDNTDCKIKVLKINMDLKKEWQ
jgi:hypothetical protein